jgi:hypothetical protein
MSTSPRQVIEVIYLINGVTCKDIFFADDSNITRTKHGSSVTLVNGRDSEGPVISAIYAHMEKEIRRPLT